ncbi:hypothetical protein B4119_0012 [Parageobacillus caldoxylosilyticus]|uniref:Uncharacterized protein n=1 Tax=Saccharococcus caldoxylosilyticus TaxID=81408 RepID=A0A150LHM1_9BACL|nr:hypothetical protein B4119_0012 [Parageobacillus caldoxylosilyticus]
MSQYLLRLLLYKIKTLVPKRDESNPALPPLLKTRLSSACTDNGEKPKMLTSLRIQHFAQGRIHKRSPSVHTTHRLSEEKRSCY